MFRFDPVTGAVRTLHTFTGVHEGTSPFDGLTLVGGQFYGVTRRRCSASDPASGATTILHTFSEGTPPVMTFTEQRAHGAAPTVSSTARPQADAPLMRPARRSIGWTRPRPPSPSSDQFTDLIRAGGASVARPGWLAVRQHPLRGRGLLRRASRRVASSAITPTTGAYEAACPVPRRRQTAPRRTRSGAARRRTATATSTAHRRSAGGRNPRFDAAVCALPTAAERRRVTSTYGDDPRTSTGTYDGFEPARLTRAPMACSTAWRRPTVLTLADGRRRVHGGDGRRRGHALPLRPGRRGPAIEHPTASPCCTPVPCSPRSGRPPTPAAGHGRAVCTGRQRRRSGAAAATSYALDTVTGAFDAHSQIVPGGAADQVRRQLAVDPRR